MSDRGSGDALLFGKGYTPDYGINDSADADSLSTSEKSSPPESIVQSIKDASKSQGRLWSVALCALIACLASLVNGLMLSFSSPTLSLLNSTDVPAHRIESDTKYASLFGVCLICSVYGKFGDFPHSRCNIKI